MSENKRKSNNTIQALWVGIGSLSSFGVAIISSAILSRYFDKVEYGTYKQIIYVYTSLLLVFNAGLPRVFAYFLPRYSLAQGKVIVTKISSFLFLNGLIFSIFLYFFSGVIASVLNNPELSTGLKYFSPIPMLLLPTLGIEGIFSTYKKTIYIAIYNTLSRIVMLLCIALPVILFKGTYINAIYGWIVSSFIILVMAYFIKGIPFKNVKSEKSDLSVKEILGYSMPLVGASIAGILYRSANQFYISRFFGPKVFAEFSNGFIEIPFVHMITGAASTVLMPVFAKMHHEKSDKSQIINLWRSTLHKSAILIYPMVIFFLFYATEIVTIVYSEAYAVSAKYFTAVMVINFFNIIVMAPLLLAMGEAKFYAQLHYGLAIATWVSQYVVYLLFNSPLAIVITFVAVAICGTFVSLTYCSKKLDVRFLDLFPLGRFLMVALHSLLSLSLVHFLLGKVMPDAHDILFLALTGICYLVILLLTAKIFKINYKEIVLPLLKRSK